MDFTSISGMNIALAVGMAVIYAKVSGARKAKQQARAAGSRREEFQIDPNSVPEFEPTWGIRDRSTLN